MNVKNNLLVVPITLGIVTIVTIILALLKLGWYYYLVGALVGLMNHGLLVKQSYRMARLAAHDPKGEIHNPKTTALLGIGIRFIVFIAVFIVLAYKANISVDKNNIWLIIIAFLGYLTLKAVLIITLFINRRKVE